MRCVGNSLMNCGKYGYYTQDNLIDLMNKNEARKQRQTSMTDLNSMSAAVSNLNTEKGVYQPQTGSWSISGNYSVALQNLESREAFNQVINDALANEGIKLSSREKITLTIDKDGQITVFGINDPQKKVKLEEVLNNAFKDDRTSLMLHIESVKAMNGKSEPGVLEKWMVYDFLKKEAGQDLGELKLVDGQIVGANDELQKILDGAADPGKDNAYVTEVITKLKSLLAYGVDKIPDLEQSIDFQDGSLVDRDVNYGFGPGQLATWFNNFISGNATYNTLA